MGGGYLRLKDTNKESELISARTLKEDNLVGVYVEDGEAYTKVEEIPDSGYILNEEKSYCKIGEEKQDMTITYDMNTQKLTIAPMTTKGTKCYLYFDKEPTLKDTILANNTVNNGIPDFSRVATMNEGLFEIEDDWGTSYYFRGAVDNNWLKFAGYYWRIIRINGDGSIRVIYNGTSTSSTGDNTMINSSQTFNSSRDRSEYVGYMYTKGEQHGNTNNSSIKEVIDNWYNGNLASYANKISIEAGFCGDREMRTGYSWSSQPSSTIYYKAYERLNTNQTPTLKCSNSNDLYTVSGSSKGNKKLTNPIGLITADEVVMAGGSGTRQNNTSYYLYNNQSYWTISPANYIFNGYAYTFGVTSTGFLEDYVVNKTYGIRPVINLAHDVVIKSGNGTSSTPYEI